MVNLCEHMIPVDAILDTILDGIITIDSAGIVLTFSRSAVRIFGYQPDDVVGQNVRMLMPEPYHTAHDGYIHNYLTTGERKIIGLGREVLGRRKDGSIFPMELGVNDVEASELFLFHQDG